MNDHRHALYLVHALTPLRIGADQGLGAIDLPTLREVHTGWPIVPGSSIKGVLREQAEQHFEPAKPKEQAQEKDWKQKKREQQEHVEAIFGPPTERAGDFRGGMVFGDAYPLLLPVRSLAGTFAWVTCAQVLRRLARDANEAKIELELPDAPTGDGVKVPSPKDGTKSKLLLDDSSEILLEDLSLKAEPDPKLDALGKVIASWAWPRGGDEVFLLERLALVPDDVFGYFCRHRLEIRARVAIDATKGTVSAGPWTEELIPAETVLCGIVQARGTTLRRRRAEDDKAGRDGVETEEVATRAPKDVFGDLLEVLGEGRTLRVGGHASVGLGRARVTLACSKETAA